MIDYIVKLRLQGWFEAYYRPDKLKDLGEGFKQQYLNSLISDFERTGKCCISKFDSITGLQVYFTDDPYHIL